MELQSNSIIELTKALVKAQEIMSPAKKTQINPFFKSKYAGLEDVIEAVKESFCKHDLAFYQGTLPGESGSIIIVTTISHISGEWIRGYLPIKPTKNDPQSLGSAITYGKRYGLQALSGQPSEDDDGNTASKKQTKKPQDDKSELLYKLDIIMSENDLTDNDKRQLVNFYCKSKKLKIVELHELSPDQVSNFIQKFDIIYKAFLDSIQA